MSIHTTVSPEEAADRLAIRELVDAYAHCADRRDAAGQMALFTEDAIFLVFMDSRAPEPSQALQGRAALAPVFDNLNTYQATTHFNGQHRDDRGRAGERGDLLHRPSRDCAG
jgi:ketosteroid isomerase-like protein